MPETQFEQPPPRPVSSRSDSVSATLRADDPELAVFLENLYARNLPEAEEASAIRQYVQLRKNRSAA